MDGPPGSDGSGDPVAALRTARAATYAPSCGPARSREAEQKAVHFVPLASVT
ncbi:hypothetical protein ACFYS7_33335 [Streptomyces avermitilis]|uniref:hypothetical protein n=1 Tax=Streptomyces avermitilis TaxID=33903 RepID=UPI0036A929B3